MKLLFIPHCLKEELSQRLREEGGKRGYFVHTIIGSSQFKKTLIRYKDKPIERIVGVACSDEVEHYAEYTSYFKEKGVIIDSFKLTNDGCKDTKINLEEIINSL